MAKKTLGKSRKIKNLPQYLGDVGVYDLSRAVKVGKDTTKFVVIAKSRNVSGGDGVSIFASDQNGKVLASKPLVVSKKRDIKEALEEFGFNLV